MYTFFSLSFAEMQLACARHPKAEDSTDDDIPSTSGRQSSVAMPSYLIFLMIIW